MSKSWGPGYFRSELFSLPPGLGTTKEWFVSVVKPEVESQRMCYWKVIANGERVKNKVCLKNNSNSFFAMK